VASSGPAPGRADLILRGALLLATVFGLVACGGALAEGIDLLPPAVEAKFDATLTPTKLSGAEQTAVSQRVAMQFADADGSHPPALKEFEIEEDRRVRLDLRGLPVCHPPLPDEPPLRVSCRKALIGRGKMRVEIAFPEQPPFTSHSDLRAYKGPVVDGRRELILAAYLTVPTPAAITATVAIERSADGRYGLKMIGSLPKIAGGSGSVTYLAVRFHKGVISATCGPDGDVDTRFAAVFADGTHLFGTVAPTCTQGQLGS
jgi:hypothetical protein